MYATPATPLNNMGSPMLSTAEIDHLWSSLSTFSVWRHREYAVPSPDTMTVFPRRRFREEIIRRSRVPSERLQSGLVDACPRFSVHPDTDMRARLAEFGFIYGTEPGVSLYDRYYLEIRDEGRVRIGYQQIAGGRHVATLDAAQSERLIDRLAGLLAQRDLEDRAAEQADAERRLRQAGRALQVAKSEDDVVQELGSLSVQDRVVRLPQEPLKHYARIKQLMLDAGGRDGSDVWGGYFEFPVGIDPTEVLTRLQAVWSTSPPSRPWDTVRWSRTFSA